eukprot:365839-Chlamydomonas_euryale.AAC.2
MLRLLLQRPANALLGTSGWRTARALDFGAKGMRSDNLSIGQWIGGLHYQRFSRYVDGVGQWLGSAVLGLQPVGRQSRTVGGSCPTRVTAGRSWQTLETVSDTRKALAPSLPRTPHPCLLPPLFCFVLLPLPSRPQAPLLPAPLAPHHVLKRGGISYTKIFGRRSDGR